MSEPDADPNPPPEQGLQDDVQHPPVGHDPTALIHDLANVVKDQQYFNAELLHATHGQLQSLTQTVESLSRRIIDLPPKSSDGLSLPNIQLPEYTGRENLDRFLLQLHGIFRASAIPAKHWLTYLKQQCQKDPGAYDALIEAESKYLRDDWSKASSDDYKHVYDECVKFLQLKRGKPKDQRIRELLSIYYTMKQQPNETVADFAHRFCEVQHELELLIPNIHHTPNGNDLELIYAFSIKLKEDINRNLVSREFAFSCLQEVIHAAARYEDQSIVKSDSLTSDSTFSKSVDKPAALYADKSYHNNTRFRSDAQRDRPDKPPSYQKSGFSPDTFSRSKVPPNRPNSSFERSSSSSQVCYAFNRYPKANCELQNNKCQHGRQHKCLTCNRVGCKQLFHANSESPSRSSRPPNKSSNSANRNVPQRNSHVSTAQVFTLLDKVESLTERMETIASTNQPVTKVPTPVSDKSQAPSFSCPAITTVASNSPQISELDLANKNILWTPVTSAGVSLPLLLDSCCSLSLVSKEHADLVLQKCPDMSFTKLSTPLPVTAASAATDLNAIGIVQIPVTWENGRPSIFSMLVVPGLTWPILFGQNHLSKTNAITDHAKLRVHFSHPSLGFTISCKDANPCTLYPLLFPSQAPAPTVSSEPQVTCLLTTAPLLHRVTQSVMLQKGFNILPLCLIFMASILRSCLFRGSHWLEGGTISPGLSVLSGPIDHSKVVSSPQLGIVPPSSDHNQPKCNSSSSSEPPESFQPVLVSMSSDNASVFALPALQETFFTNVVIYSTQANVSLPINASLGVIRTAKLSDTLEFDSAVQ